MFSAEGAVIGFLSGIHSACRGDIGERGSEKDKEMLKELKTMQLWMV